MNWPWWAWTLTALGAATLLACFLVGVVLPAACWIHDLREARRARTRTSKS